MITTFSQFHANSKDGQTKQYETTDNKITYKVLMRLEYERTVFKASKESILSIIVLKRKHKRQFFTYEKHFFVNASTTKFWRCKKSHNCWLHTRSAVSFKQALDSSALGRLSRSVENMASHLLTKYITWSKSCQSHHSLEP